MIVAVAVCPAAPWLLAGVAPRLAARASDVAAAAVAAVATLAETDRIVVVLPPSPARPDPERRPGAAVVAPGSGGAAGTVSALLTGRVAVSRSDRGAGPMLSVAPAVASQLLARAGVDRPTTVVTATGGSLVPPDGVDDPTVRIGLLVLADGAAAHGPSAPGREDLRSAELDGRLTGALVDGSPGELSAATDTTADPAPGDLLARVDGLRVVADWTRHRPPQRASLLAYAAPFGVGYLVATWRWTGPARATGDR